MKTAAVALTVADIDAGFANPAWNGWGYLGERERFAFTGADTHPTFAGAVTQAIARADAVLLRLANERSWSADQLFTWLNSRNGRHYADMAFGERDEAVIEATARRWRIVVEISDVVL